MKQAYITSVCHLAHTCHLSHSDPNMLLSWNNGKPCSIHNHELQFFAGHVVSEEGSGGERVMVSLPPDNRELPVSYFEVYFKPLFLIHAFFWHWCIIL
jgi:hypothetical protein